MRETFDKCIGLILDSEGPELNVGGSEPGGASRYGVSVDALTDWFRRSGRPPATVADVRDMTADLASTIYRAMYADRIRFDDMPVGVDYTMLDKSINLGVTGGARLLQVTLGIWPVTGKFDDETIISLGAIDPSDMIHMIGAAWLAKKFESPGFVTAGHGWTNRRNRVDKDALKLAGAL